MQYVKNENLQLKQGLRYFGIFVLTMAVLGIVALVDLTMLGTKAHWSTFDKVRVKTYLKTGAFFGYITPPISVLSFVHYGSIIGNAAISSELPDIKNMHFLREVLMDSKGNAAKKDDSFETRLQHHEEAAVRLFRKNGTNRYMREVKQRVPFNDFGLPLFDDWMVLLCTDIVAGKPKTSFLAWGMGATTDKNAPSFFGNQLGKYGGLMPLHWINGLEREGIMKGYWMLLTETDDTSSFSYEARREQPSVRKSKWLKQVKTYHEQGKGYSAKELYEL